MDRTGVRDETHFAYSTFARAAAQRRNNLLASVGGQGISLHRTSVNNIGNVAVLSGTGNVLAPFLGSALFEAIRTVANQYAPNVWQMTLGIAMLAIIVFLPTGLWSLFRRRARSS